MTRIFIVDKQTYNSTANDEANFMGFLCKKFFNGYLMYDTTEGKQLEKELKKEAANNSKEIVVTDLRKI